MLTLFSKDMERRYFKDNNSYFKWFKYWRYRVDIYKVYNSRGKVVVLYNKKCE